MGLKDWWRGPEPESRAAREQRLRQQFSELRAQLEADFFRQASSRGKPRGLRWVECQFTGEPSFARHKTTALLVAFVRVTISFEAIPGGGMEEVEAVGNLRVAAAMFHEANEAWQTQGRALFNLLPDECADFFKTEYESIQFEDD